MRQVLLQGFRVFWGRFQNWLQNWPQNWPQKLLETLIHEHHSKQRLRQRGVQREPQFHVLLTGLEPMPEPQPQPQPVPVPQQEAEQPHPEELVEQLSERPFRSQLDIRFRYRLLSQLSARLELQKRPTDCLLLKSSELYCFRI